ncbi:hypothetical protein chiPu_0025650, partial [Chiloscyllium punctatum]|nr:hypothetical protein [Chiloscyllium punctatum]
EGLAVEFRLAADQQLLFRSDTVSLSYVPAVVKATTRMQDLGPMGQREFRPLDPSEADSLQAGELGLDRLCVRCRLVTVSQVFVLVTPLPTPSFGSRMMLAALPPSSWEQDSNHAGLVSPATLHTLTVKPEPPFRL